MFMDTGGASDHVFALIGKRFTPRLHISRVGKFHTFEKADSYPALTQHIGAPMNAALILEHWDDLLRLAASITTCTIGELRVVQPAHTITHRCAPKLQFSKVARKNHPFG